MPLLSVVLAQLLIKPFPGCVNHCETVEGGICLFGQSPCTMLRALAYSRVRMRTELESDYFASSEGISMYTVLLTTVLVRCLVSCGPSQCS